MCVFDRYFYLINRCGVGLERLQSRGESPATELLRYGEHDFVRARAKLHIHRVRAERGYSKE